MIDVNRSFEKRRADADQVGAEAAVTAVAAVARAGVEEVPPRAASPAFQSIATEPFGPGGGIDFAQTGQFCGFGRMRFREPVEPRLIRGTQVLLTRRSSIEIL